MSAFSLGDFETDLSEVTATGYSTAFRPKGTEVVCFQTISTGVTTGATIKIQGSQLESPTAATATHWYDLATISADADESHSAVVDEPHRWLRANITAYTDGTHSVVHRNGERR